MKIYVDGMFYRLSGIGRCYENVLRALLESDEVSKVATVVPRGREDEFRRSFPDTKLESRFVDFDPLSLSDFFRKGPIINGFHPRPDLCYFPNFNVPFFLEGKTISTVCDLIPISKYSDLPWRKRAGFRYLVGRALRNSVKTVCISEFTKRQVIDTYGTREDRLAVIYPWVNEGFLEVSSRPHDMERLVEGDYLLYVGNRFLHKNLKCLTGAFRTLVQEFPSLKVVVAGARMRSRDDVDVAAEDPVLRGKVVQFLGFGDEQIRNLYAHAKVFVFPTFIEGFGIPPLEAMAHGVPVVCSDIPVIREVCGVKVHYADPEDPGSFASAIRGILLDPPNDLSRGMKNQGCTERFGKEKSAGQYLELFRACSGKVL